MTCTRESVRRAVQSALARYKPKEDAADQSLILPGFDHIQCAYSVKRDNEQVVVPVGKMSLTEINGKIDEIEAMGRGCFEHAKELQRYRDDRFSAPRLDLAS